MLILRDADVYVTKVNTNHIELGLPVVGMGRKEGISMNYSYFEFLEIPKTLEGLHTSPA